MKVYVEVKEKMNVVYKHIPLLEVEVEKGVSLGSFLIEKDKKIEELSKEVARLEKVSLEAEKVSKEIKNYFAEILKQIGGIK